MTAIINKENSKVFLLILLGMLSAFGPFVTDMYLPSLPSHGRLFFYPLVDGAIGTYHQYDRSGIGTNFFRTIE